MAALRFDEGERVEEGVQKFFDLMTRLEGGDLNYSDLHKKTKLLAILPDSWSLLIINLNRVLPRLSLEAVKREIVQEDFRRRELAVPIVPELQAWVVGMTVEGVEGEKADLVAITSMEAVEMDDMAATTTIMATGVGAVDLMANATFATRPATCGEIALDCPMDGPFLKAKRTEEQGEEEAEVMEAVVVVEAKRQA
ncbi:hypothetical protein CLOP_g10644 [Closterium sp. NIES-67]|nr:hypothetical protein CLOP_g10644 [Closterium sp. NIES-67]